jgi:hypothetical protein
VLEATQEPSEHLIGVEAGQAFAVMAQVLLSATQKPSEHMMLRCGGQVTGAHLVESGMQEPSPQVTVPCGQTVMAVQAEAEVAQARLGHLTGVDGSHWEVVVQNILSWTQVPSGQKIGELAGQAEVVGQSAGSWRQVLS